MIVVTGLRSGTSLMMQTLKLLGVPVVGYMFHDDFSHKELNPKGYYDLPINETIKGLNTYKYKGKAVKLGGYQLSATESKYVNKIIVCERNRQDTIKSIMRLMKADFSIAKVNPTEENATILHEINKNITDEYIKNMPYIRINHENMVLDPSKTITKLCVLLNIETDLSNAINNVEKRVVWQ